MSKRNAANTTPQSSSKPSLEEIRTLILADESLPLARRRDMVSALTCLAKALGCPAEIIKANPAELRLRLDKLTPAMVGMTTGRWRNVISLATSALAHTGHIVIQGRIREAPSADWKAILDLTKPLSSAHYHLGRFGRWATKKGVTPSDMSDLVIVDYCRELTSASLVDSPERSAREAARGWNAAAAAHADWPYARLIIPDNRNIFSLEWDAYPATLKEDVDAWLAWLADKDIFSERPSAPLRPASIVTRKRQLRSIIGVLALKGVDPASLVDLKAVVTLEHAKLALNHFFEKAGKVGTSHTHQLAGVLLMLARHWVKLPASDLEVLRKGADGLRPKSWGMTQRNTDRLRGLEDERRYELLLNLPSEYLRLAQRSPHPDVHTALLVQTAVMVNILLQLPLRLGNLRDLMLGKNLLRDPGGMMFVSFSAADVKNGVQIDCTFTKETTKLIDLYIEVYRPILCKGGDWLFPGRTATAPKSAVGLRDQLCGAIADHCGLIFTPHLFRHLAAWQVLREDPTAHGVVQRILGHKSSHSTMAFYCGLETGAALKHLDSIVESNREKSSKKKPGSRPRRKR